MHIFSNLIHCSKINIKFTASNKAIIITASCGAAVLIIIAVAIFTIRRKQKANTENGMLALMLDDRKTNLLFFVRSHIVLP